MRFDYESILIQQIYDLRNRLALDDLEFSVSSEQAFLKRKDMAPNTIYVLIRELQNDNSIGVDTQPVQILILSEQNSLEIAKSFFSQFAKRYNFDSFNRVQHDNGETANFWVKQQYTDPVVLNNFNTISHGYRSVLYMSAVLYIMQGVVDLRDLKVDGEDITALAFDIAYNMQPSTQQISGTFISRSIKSVSSMALTLTIPSTESGLYTKILRIMDEADTSPEGDNPLGYGGNEDFIFDFYLGSYHFENKAFKLTSADFGAAVNNVPAIRLGFIK